MEEKLIAIPRKLRSLANAFCFALGETATVILYCCLADTDNKVLKTIITCVLIIATLFLVPAVIYSLRSLYPRAILTVTKDRIILEKKSEMLLSEVESVSVINGKRLVVTGKNGETIKMHKNNIDVPIETMAIAIKTKMEEMEK